MPLLGLDKAGDFEQRVVEASGTKDEQAGDQKAGGACDRARALQSTSNHEVRVGIATRWCPFIFQVNEGIHFEFQVWLRPSCWQTMAYIYEITASS